MRVPRAQTAGIDGVGLEPISLMPKCLYASSDHPPHLARRKALTYSGFRHPPMQQSSTRRRFLKKAGLAGGGIALGVVGLNEISPSIWRPPLVFEPNRSFWARSQAPPNPPL